MSKVKYIVLCLVIVCVTGILFSCGKTVALITKEAAVKLKDSNVYI